MAPLWVVTEVTRAADDNASRWHVQQLNKMFKGFLHVASPDISRDDAWL
jgi:hypothetical protein